MKIKLRRDLVSGIVLMIFMAIVWLIIPNQIVVKSDANSSAQLFPKIIVGMMFILSLYIALRAAITKKDTIIEIDIKKEWKIALYVVSLFIYVFLLDKIGFLLSSLLISYVNLFVYKTKFKGYIVMSIVVVVVYLTFTAILDVPLPSFN